MKEKLNPNCGIRLRECREAAGMTQKQLADEIHTTYQSISNIERGERRLTVDNARAAAKVLNVRMEYLLCEDDIRTSLDSRLSFVKETKDLCIALNIIAVLTDGVTTSDGDFIIKMSKDNKDSYIQCSYEEISTLVESVKYLYNGWYNELLINSNKVSQKMLKGKYESSEPIKRVFNVKPTDDFLSKADRKLTREELEHDLNEMIGKSIPPFDPTTLSFYP